MKGYISDFETILFDHKDHKNDASPELSRQLLIGYLSRVCLLFDFVLFFR